MNDPDRSPWLTLPDGTTITPIPPAPPFAAEVSIDSQSLYFQGPTPDAVIEMKRRWEAEHEGPGLFGGDKPHVVEGQP